MTEEEGRVRNGHTEEAFLASSMEIHPREIFA